MRCLFTTLVMLVVGGSIADAEDTPPIQLTAENFAAWQAHIRPTAAELAPLRTIPWRTTFAEGLEAAAAESKPVLFWTMNGHPLGCT